MDWQPIETAPKVEWAEIVAWDGDGVCIAYWTPPEDGFEGYWSTRDGICEYPDNEPLFWLANFKGPEVLANDN